MRTRADPGGPTISRRGLIKTVGLSAGGLAAYRGAGELDVEPVGEADAIAPVIAGGVGLVVGGAVVAAGVGVANYLSDPDDPDTSATDVLQDSIYSAATTVAEGRSTFEQEMQAQYVDRAQGESPYANAAWSEIRAAVAREVVNGNSESEAEQAAVDALEAQTRISLHNVFERWNTGVTAFAPHMVADLNNSVGTISPLGTGNPSPDNFSNEVEADAGPVVLRLGESVIDVPGSTDEVEELDSDLKVLSISNGADSASEGPLDTFTSDTSNGEWGIGGTVQMGGTGDLQASHPDYSTQIVLKKTLYKAVTRNIEAEYQSISSDVSTYVTNLVSALDQGAIDAEDIYSPRDMVSQFAGSDKRSRVASELAAAGASVPEETSWEAQISHPDIQSSELWVDLYPQWSGDPVSMEPGVTLATGDYNLAYIGYYSEESGEYVTDVLSGDSPLDILDVAGVEGEADATDSAPDAAASDGAINLGSEPPDEIQNPGEYDDSFNLVIETADSGTFTAPVADVETQSGDYVLPAGSSPLSGDETLEAVRVVPIVETTQTSTFVADPTSVDSQQVQDAIQAQQDMVESVEELEDSGDGGIGLPSFGLGGAGGAIAAVVGLVGGGYILNRIFGSDDS